MFNNVLIGLTGIYRARCFYGVVDEKRLVTTVAKCSPAVRALIYAG